LGHLGVSCPISIHQVAEASNQCLTIIYFYEESPIPMLISPINEIENPFLGPIILKIGFSFENQT
jgi:hypothetical protein